MIGEKRAPAPPPADIVGFVGQGNVAVGAKIKEDLKKIAASPAAVEVRNRVVEAYRKKGHVKGVQDGDPWGIIGLVETLDKLEVTDAMLSKSFVDFPPAFHILLVSALNGKECARFSRVSVDLRLRARVVMQFRASLGTAPRDLLCPAVLSAYPPGPECIGKSDTQKTIAGQPVYFGRCSADAEERVACEGVYWAPVLLYPPDMELMYFKQRITKFLEAFAKAPGGLRMEHLFADGPYDLRHWHGRTDRRIAVFYPSEPFDSVLKARKMIPVAAAPFEPHMVLPFRRAVARAVDDVSRPLIHFSYALRAFAAGIAEAKMGIRPKLCSVCGHSFIYHQNIKKPPKRNEKVIAAKKRSKEAAKRRLLLNSAKQTSKIEEGGVLVDPILGRDFKLKDKVKPADNNMYRRLQLGGSSEGTAEIVGGKLVKTYKPLPPRTVEVIPPDTESESETESSSDDGVLGTTVKGELV
jgi:hypothetical protein